VAGDIGVKMSHGVSLSWVSFQCGLAFLAALLASCDLRPPLKSITPSPSPEPTNLSPKLPATFSWITYEAEEARTSGTVCGPSREYLTPEAEASGRTYVRLDKSGDYIEFAAKEPADAVVLRYCIPDAENGGGRDMDIELLVNGQPRTKINLTSRFAWIYGDFPWSNDPSLGKAHHFFDESQSMVGPIKAGDTVRLQVGELGSSDYVLLDFVELETVPPAVPRPEGSLSLTDFGAVPNDAKDDSPAFAACVEAAKRSGSTIWIPDGVFRLEGSRMKLGGIRIQGAGMWRSKLEGPGTMFDGTGEPLHVADLAIFGTVDRRVDNIPENAFHGNLGDGSTFRRVWLEHHKCGFWTTYGTKNMLLSESRLRNLMADGLNFCDGTSYSTVENCHLRNTGDDALATWSPTTPDAAGHPSTGNTFIGNRIQFPWLANGLAVYGGKDHRIVGNYVEGGVFSGGGLLLSSGFDAIPFSGTIRAANNTFKDTGGDCYIGQAIGSLWIYALHSDIEIPLEIDGLNITQARGDAITVHGPKTAKDIRLANVTVDGAAGNVIRIYPETSGRMQVKALRAGGYAGQLVENGNPQKFEVILDPPVAP